MVDTRVNFGDTDARLLVQVSWEGGTYSLPPLHIPAGHSYRLDVAEVARQQIPDNLGRTLDPDFRRGFLHWVTTRGHNQVIDRMEFRRRDSRDGFGFRYATCCLSEPFGDLIPGTGVANFGSNGPFVASEYIGTCTGTLGPYNADSPMLTYSSPVSWNGLTVSASTLASQMASFVSYAESIESDPYDGCIPGIVEITDDGPVFVDECREEFHPDPTFNPGKGCVQETNFCTACYSCCLLEKRVGTCQCEELGGLGLAACPIGLDATCLNCEQQCRGKFGTGCSGIASRCSGP